jgi:hypothetical protein
VTDTCWACGLCQLHRAAGEPALAGLSRALGGPAVTVEGAAGAAAAAAAASSSSSGSGSGSAVEEPAISLTTDDAPARMDAIDAAREAVEARDSGRGCAPDGSEILFAGGLAWDIAHLTGGPVRKGGRKHLTRSGAAAPGSSSSSSSAAGGSKGAAGTGKRMGEVATGRNGRRRSHTMRRVFAWTEVAKAGNQS